MRRPVARNTVNSPLGDAGGDVRIDVARRVREVTVRETTSLQMRPHAKGSHAKNIQLPSGTTLGPKISAQYLFSIIAQHTDLSLEQPLNTSRRPISSSTLEIPDPTSRANTNTRRHVRAKSKFKALGVINTQMLYGDLRP